MKALSIQQPWAYLIASGLKDIENRDWSTRFRGKFLIHTGMKFDRNFDESFFRNIKIPANLPLGGIVGIAEITGCVTRSDSPWFFGPYGFVIRNANPLPFRPLGGKLGFFDVDYATQQNARLVRQAHNNEKGGT